MDFLSLAAAAQIAADRRDRFMRDATRPNRPPVARRPAGRTARFGPRGRDGKDDVGARR